MEPTKMARPYISAELRKLVAERADFLCEYCLISASDRVSGCQVDYIMLNMGEQLRLIICATPVFFAIYKKVQI
jgi:hypothetical protein